MRLPKVLVNNPTVPSIAFDILSQRCDLITTDDTSREETLAKIAGVKAIFWASLLRLDTEILDRAGPQLKVVATISAGLDHIDLTELKKRGIKLANTSKVQDDAVADLAVLLVLAASRRLHESRLKIEEGEWKFDLQWMLGKDLSGATVGIVGLGGIGQAVCKRLKIFNVAKFHYCGHRERPEASALNASFVSFEELLQKSDFIIVTCPLTDETKNLFNDETFGKMKEGAVFVNVSRGEVVDQMALVKALKSKLFAAGLDVMTPEPINVDNELLKLPNCVIVPHIGSATVNTRNAMAELTAKNILRGLGGEEMLTPVDLSNI